MLLLDAVSDFVSIHFVDCFIDTFEDVILVGWPVLLLTLISIRISLGGTDTNWKLPLPALEWLGCYLV
jgi:hypothetical protein